MAQSKRLFIKRLGLPIMCFVVLFMFLKPNTLYWKPAVADQDLVKMLRTLQRAQLQNKIILIQTDIDSLGRNSQKSNNSSNAESAEDLQRKATRKLFDSRPDASSSQLPGSSHPLFPGYIIENPDVCQDENVDVLVYLHSYSEHRDLRRQIRETWGNPRTFVDINVKLLFFVGRPTDNLTQNQIESEFSTYGDVIQGDFMDTFKNLTYKAITMLNWVNAHCANVRYIVKVDDDMFVDMFRVISDLVPKLATQKMAVACDVKINMPIPRDPGIKWYVNESLLPGRASWPTFCSGYFVVFTGDSIPALYKASFDIQQFIPIDDAYLFGLLVERNMSMEFINIHDQISVNERPDPDKEISVNGKFEFISFRVKSYEDHTKLWKLRSNKLSPWEQVHSSYFKAFHHSEAKTLLVV